MEIRHVTPKLSDYILDLLPSQERRLVEQHAAHCETCHEALRAERALHAAVRETLQAVATPSTAQLQRLMPPPPSPPQNIVEWLTSALPNPSLRGWQRPLAAMTVVALLFVASLSLQLGPAGLWEATVPANSVAVTATTLPTSTSTTTVTSTALPQQPAAEPTPIPEATPIAQVPLYQSPPPLLHGQ